MKAKKAIILSFLVFLLFGIFTNSAFFNTKKDEVYSQMKEEYQLSSDTDTNEKKEQEENESTEEAVATEEIEEKEEEKVTSRGSNENRTRENIIWDYLIDAGYSKVQVAGIIR